MSGKSALITGINGQDGSYLAELLLGKGYRVVGVTRDPAARPSINLAHVADRVELEYCSYEPLDLTRLVKRVGPAEVYNLAGQSYVSKSWEMLDDTLRASAILPCHLLEAIRVAGDSARLFQASSSEIYLPQDDEPLTEESPISPYNPYGCSKALAHQMVQAYRRNYGLFAVNGVLFNHDSPRRPANFAFKKIVRGAVRIRMGLDKALVMGRLDVARDWGYAPDFVHAMHRMLHAKNPMDLNICSGTSRTVQEVVEAVFQRLELDPSRYLKVDNKMVRRFEPKVVQGANQKARKSLGWTPPTTFERMVDKMVDYEMRMQQGEVRDFSDEHAI